jgi:hypothetical protein
VYEPCEWSAPHSRDRREDVGSFVTDSDSSVTDSGTNSSEDDLEAWADKAMCEEAEARMRRLERDLGHLAEVDVYTRERPWPRWEMSWCGDAGWVD